MPNSVVALSVSWFPAPLPGLDGPTLLIFGGILILGLGFASAKFRRKEELVRVKY